VPLHLVGAVFAAPACTSMFVSGQIVQPRRTGQGHRGR
jgi:hypothetical protein